jgi:hypothetical protein
MNYLQSIVSVGVAVLLAFGCARPALTKGDASWRQKKHIDTNDTTKVNTQTTHHRR